MIDGFKIGTAAASLEASYEFYFGRRKPKMTNAPTMKNNALSQLLAEIDDLCHVYIGKDAPSEQWSETCQRIIRINKLRKRARAIAEKNNG